MTDTALPSPLSTPGPWDLVAEDYDKDVLPTFQTYARVALDLAGVQNGARVVDVACGPGTLSLLAAEAGADVEAIDFSPNMIERLAHRLVSDGVSRVRARVGDGQALPFPDGVFDCAFSMFGLMFFPDRAAGYRELFRVLAPGGRAVVSSWLPFAEVPLFVTVFGALNAADPAPGPRITPPLTTPADHEREMGAAGFASLRVERVEGSVSAASTADLWAGMQRSNAVAVMMRKRLGEEAWAGVSQSVLAALHERFGDGPQTVVFPAWVAVGTKPG